MDIIVNMEAGDWWLIAFCVGVLIVCGVMVIFLYAAEREERHAMTPEQLQQERDDRVM